MNVKTVVLAGLVLSSVSAAAFAEPAVRTITDDGGRYCGWPTVTRLRSGEIVATYSGGRDGHICPWGKVRAVRSKDGGETWTKPETLVDGPLDDRDAALLSFGRRAYTDAERKAGWRIGAYAAVSAGDAKPDSWDLDHVVTLLRTENNDMAYPSTVELDDGGFLSVYYYHPDGNPNAVLGATRWHLPNRP